MTRVNVTDTLSRAGDNHYVGANVAATPKPRNRFRRQAMGATFRVGLLYSAITVPLLFLREEVEPDVFLLLLSFLGALCFFLLWRAIDWGDYRLLSFGPVFLLTSVCFRLVSFLDVLIFGNRIAYWLIHAKDPLLYVAFGEFTYIAGALVVVGTWLAFRGHERSIAIIKSWRYDRPILVVAYVIGVSVVLSTRVLDFNLAFLGSILHNFAFVAMLSILLISLGSSQRRTWGGCVLLPLLLSSPIIYGALRTGMKEIIIFSVLPAAIGIFVVVTEAWKRTVVGLMLVIVLAFMTIFVNIHRDVNWSEEQGLSPVHVFYATVDAFLLDNDLWATAFENLLSRKNLLEVDGWSFAIVENHGHFFEEFSPHHVYQIFIPRVLWAEKSQFRPGADFSELALGPGMSDVTSTAAGYFSALYLGSGLWGVFIYSALTGALHAFSLAVVMRFGSSFAQLLFLSASLYKALRLDEGWPVYEFAGTISMLVFAILFGNAISSIQERRARGERRGAYV